MPRKLQASFLFVLLTFILSSSAISQQLDHVQGELLVKLSPDAGIDFRSWLAKQNTLQGLPTPLEYKEQVSKPMDIHSITFDHNQVNEIDLLAAINRDPFVQAAQFNHLIAFRSTIPNDPEFPSQWQYINTVGTLGADIDMDLAWDFTTGGLTPDGDTIVACVIDDGINLNHPDFGDNLWVNWREIPDNGIDDDNNGYIDDYYGWDTNEDSDDIGDGGGHGTPVAGIVGAKGNNGVGVAGVNWDVKLMIIQNSGLSESQVLEAYSYPLLARQRYNATDGAEGAFVVSTNASWGIDGGQPADAPLWCAFYDTLGVHGILSCGATINGNQNVDTFGDLPTGCSSEYLITVTNMNWDDEKVEQAGYGLETIDLGAFGQGTWTTSSNGYGSFGGTSGATPHVTGTIALLYAAECPLLINIAKDNPGLAAEMVRDFILYGVDPNESLEGITVTGGRLNVANAISELLLNCGDCPPPARVEVDMVEQTSARLLWVQSDSLLTTDFYLKPMGSTDWTTVAYDVSAPYQLEDLDPCTEYEIQLVGYCSSDTSYSSISNFLTLGCGACIDYTYCNPANLDADFEWIERIAVGNMDVTTGNDEGYGDFTQDFTTVMGQGETIDIELDPGFSIDPREERWYIWIDLNHNGQLNDPGEKIFSIRSAEQVRESITIPADAILGPTRMRVAISYDQTTWSCFSNADNGEIEDYCITIVETVTPCTAAESLLADNITDVSADLSWVANIASTDQTIRYKKVSETVWTEISGLTTSAYTLTGLDYYTEYEFQVKSKCEATASSSGFSDSEFFTTLFASSTKELGNTDRWEVYPNPFSDVLTLELVLVNPQSELRVELMDQLGRKLIKQRETNVGVGIHQIVLETGELASGIYFLQVIDGSGNTVSKRVVK